MDESKTKLLAVAESSEVAFFEIRDGQLTGSKVFFLIDEIRYLCKKTDCDYEAVLGILKVFLSKLFFEPQLVGYEGLRTYVQCECNSLKELQVPKEEPTTAVHS